MPLHKEDTNLVNRVVEVLNGHTEECVSKGIDDSFEVAMTQYVSILGLSEDMRNQINEKFRCDLKNPFSDQSNRRISLSN